MGWVLRAPRLRTSMAFAHDNKQLADPPHVVPDAGDSVPDLGKDAELKAYRDMLLIRRFEEKAGQMYGMGLIGGFCHLYIGQEAVVVGMQLALTPGDQVITGYRDHGHMLACGMDPKGVMAELTGRRDGYIPRARAARCTCSASRRGFMAPRHRRRPGLARHRHRLRQLTATTERCA